MTNARLNTYNSGKPCLRGHYGLRYLSTHACVHCMRERHRGAMIRRNSAMGGEKVLTVYLPAGQLEEARALAGAMGWRLFDGREQLV